MAFHTQYFKRPIRNSSAGYDYEEWSKTGRKEAAKQVTKETRKQPQAEEPLELGSGRARGHAARRDAHLLGGPSPLDGPEHDEPDALQHRFPHREHR